MSRGWRVRTALGATSAPLAILALSMSGCGTKSEYPPNFTFPSRTDLLVVKTPDVTPPSVGEPGKIDEELARLTSLGGKTIDPAAVPAAARAELDEFLKESFGTPAAPAITLPAGGDETHVAALGLAPETLADGGKLFRKHCLQCHNLTGDGRGPAGLWVNPYPRDYRRGTFKFTTAGTSGKPRRSDLQRTLTDGLKGTAMPSFGLLPQVDRDRLAAYVIFLALRGATEFHTLVELSGGETRDPRPIALRRLNDELLSWSNAQAAPAVPPPHDGEEPVLPAHRDAVKRGYELFTRKADNSCITCHADFGRKPVLRYDIWGTVSKPADFTALTLKGGTKPEDLFARIRGGIPAVGMPAHPELSDRQIWDLVRFVKSAPFRRELPLELRGVIYPETGGAP